ncbi:MAG: BON domain-containing protein [Acidobacteriota bacterium]
MKTNLRTMTAVAVFGLLAAPAALPEEHYTGAALSQFERQVRHELIMLPYYGVFDNLAFRVDGREVTLLGQVSRPTLKTDAERVVARLEGVEKVVNQIEVLPLSSFDGRIRLQAYWAIYGHSAMLQHAVQPIAPIRIIVKNGNVTLEGAAASEMAKNIANLQANGVPGVFSVTNNLVVNP